jgi:hypothetical protein
VGRVAAGAFDAFDDDDYRWWIARQAAAVDISGVHRTLGHRDSQEINAWFAARDARNELGGYAADVERGWLLAEDAVGSPEAMGLQCRYALLRAVIGDLAGRYRPTLAALLVRRGVWTREQALAWAGVNIDSQSALHAVADALRTAEGARREALVSLALATSARMISTDDRALMLAEMAHGAAPHEVAALLDAIGAEQNSGARDSAGSSGSFATCRRRYCPAPV